MAAPAPTFSDLYSDAAQWDEPVPDYDALILLLGGVAGTTTGAAVYDRATTMTALANLARRSPTLVAFCPSDDNGFPRKKPLGRTDVFVDDFILHTTHTTYKIPTLAPSLFSFGPWWLTLGCVAAEIPPRAHETVTSRGSGGSRHSKLPSFPQNHLPPRNPPQICGSILLVVTSSS